MPEIFELTPKQKVAIDQINDICKANGLRTYTQLEEHGAMLGVAAYEALDMGKQLCKQLSKLQAENKRLRKAHP